MQAVDEIRTIKGCARCHGEGHESLLFKAFVHPVEIKDEPPFTHYAICPVTDDPIMLQIWDEEGSDTFAESTGSWDTYGAANE